MFERTVDVGKVSRSICKMRRIKKILFKSGPSFATRANRRCIQVCSKWNSVRDVCAVLAVCQCSTIENVQRFFMAIWDT